MKHLSGVLRTAFTLTNVRNTLLVLGTLSAGCGQSGDGNPDPSATAAPSDVAVDPTSGEPPSGGTTVTPGAVSPGAVSPGATVAPAPHASQPDNVTPGAGPSATTAPAMPSSTVQPAPSTVQPAPSTVQPAPSTVQPAPSTVQPAPSTDMTESTSDIDTTTDDTSTAPDTSDTDSGGAVNPNPTPGGPVLLSEDFESHASGARPEGYDVFCSYQLNPADCGDNTVEVTTERAHGGSQAMLLQGGATAAQLAWNLPQGTTRVYTRAWVYLSNRKLGNNSDGNHETLIALRGTPEGVSNEIRFGEIKGAIGTNIEPTDNISPPASMWNSGPEIATQSWACVEVAFLGDLPTQELHAWVNGQPVHAIDTADDWAHGVDGAWMSSWMDGKFTQLVFGWQSFSGFDEKVFMDDIIISTEPIGCD